MDREEAIKIVRNIYQTDAEKEALGTLIPELRESEDERIRNVLVSIVKWLGFDSSFFVANSVTKSEVLNYLEKQKSVDDKVFEEWVDDCWKHYKVNNPDSYDKGDEIQFDERGFKNFCRRIRNLYRQKPTEWSEEDEDMFVRVLHFLNTNRINERGKVITWVESLPKRFSLQPKQEWNDLESYAQKVEDYYDVGEERGYLCVHRGEVKDAVIAGAKWQKEQMMKEAVEGEIIKDNRGNNVVRTGVFNNGFEIGDKVRIIIVKED